MAEEKRPGARSDKLVIANEVLSSRLLIGSGGANNLEILDQILTSSNASVVTVALRRIDPAGSRSLLEVIAAHHVKILPNTAGCFTAHEAVVTARLCREAFSTNWIKLEVIADEKSLLPDPIEVVAAAETLVGEGFVVLPYASDDPVLCRRLEAVGCAAVMPLGAPIGSGLGISNPHNLAVITEHSSIPVIVDAGIGTASDASLAMELGCDGVMIASAITKSKSPAEMAGAFALAIDAGHRARLAGRIPRRHQAEASSSFIGLADLRGGTLMGAETPLVALSIAGSDSSGGAGISADLKTFAAHRIFGTVALTAITAQNTTGVSDMLACAPGLVDAQIDAVMSDLPVAIAKTGMLATVEIIEMLIARAEADKLPELVIDPVMVASSGAALFSGDAALHYRRLLGFASVTTPNLAEAETLLGKTVRNVAQMKDVARELCDLGVSTAVVKGGHLDGPVALDIVCDGGEIFELGADRIASRNTHGTGCTLSAAIAANVALGYSRLEAVGRAKSYVSEAIATSATWQLGKGNGPLEHFPATWLGQR